MMYTANTKLACLVYNVMICIDKIKIDELLIIINYKLTDA